MVWRLMTLIVLMGLVVGDGPRAYAQGADDLAALQIQVSQLYDQGKYAEALPMAERYVALARQKNGEEHTDFATAIAWLAYVYRAQGRYPEAEPLYKRSLAIGEKALGPDHPDVGTMCFQGENLEEQRVHCALQPDMQLTHLPFGTRENHDA